MPKLKPHEWSRYMDVYEDVMAKLSARKWFADGWTTSADYLNKANPTGVWMQLVRDTWFDGAIHIETWLRNAQLQDGELTVALHIETSKARHGMNRNVFSQVLLEKAGARIESWPGWTTNHKNPPEPCKCQVEFTDKTLASVLVREFTRIQALGKLIDRTIEACRI